MDRVRIGIVGCGSIANGLYLPGIAAIPQAEGWDGWPSAFPVLRD